jgi:hypothetical protein
LRYSFEKHKLTKLENHEGKEITVEELVDQYYKDLVNFLKLIEIKAMLPRLQATAGELQQQLQQLLIFPELL